MRRAAARAADLGRADRWARSGRTPGRGGRAGDAAAELRGRGPGRAGPGAGGGAAGPEAAESVGRGVLARGRAVALPEGEGRCLRGRPLPAARPWVFGVAGAH